MRERSGQFRRVVCNSYLIITIDTEGDNLWENPESVSTKNASFLYRFQHLCESYGFKPTYLVSYEMAVDEQFQTFAHSLLGQKTAEIGCHTHVQNSPPPITPAEWRHYPVYVTELPESVIDEKIEYMTRLLMSTFKVRPVSHRGGRWAFDEKVARVLVRHGYLVDCSVTPGISWQRYKGAPNGTGGTSYVDFGIRPYFVDLNDVRRPGSSPLLEVPMTVRTIWPALLQRAYHYLETRLGLAADALSAIAGKPYLWLRPDGHNLNAMISLVNWGLDQDLPVLEFMLHSSELMPGGSPNFKTSADIEQLYQHVDRLFKYIASNGITSETLAGYRRRL
jgi:hypothetical protein